MSVFKRLGQVIALFSICIFFAACIASSLYSPSLPPIPVNRVAPTTLTFPIEDFYAKGVRIVDIVPTIDGDGPFNFTITPDLPAGLTFDHATGTISGAPTEVVSGQTYSVSVNNSSGWVYATFNLTIYPSFITNSTLDSGDAIPGDGICDDGSGNCTFRAAIDENNASSETTVITLPAYTGTPIRNYGTKYNVSKDLLLKGDPDAPFVFDGQDNMHMFDFNSDNVDVGVYNTRFTDMQNRNVLRRGNIGDLTVKNVTYDNGNGKFANPTTLTNATVDGSTFQNINQIVLDLPSPLSVTVTNSNFDGSGGNALDIAAVTDLTVSNTVFQNNDGVSIRANSANTSITDCEFTGNTSSGFSAGFFGTFSFKRNYLHSNNISGLNESPIYLSGMYNDDVTVEENKFAENTKGNTGASAIYVQGVGRTVTIRNNTFYRESIGDSSDAAIQVAVFATANLENNTFLQSDAAIDFQSGVERANLTGNLFFGNTENFETAVAANIDSSSYNVSDRDEGYLTDASNKLDATNLDFISFANHGGSNKTAKIGSSSEALNFVPIASCPSTDQRGVKRSGSTCDAGAYEAD